MLADARIDEASRLLVESDRKIIDIALDLGYSDPAHFTRAFRAWTGSSPRDFRAAYGGARGRSDADARRERAVTYRLTMAIAPS